MKWLLGKARKKKKQTTRWRPTIERLEDRLLLDGSGLIDIDPTPPAQFQGSLTDWFALQSTTSAATSTGGTTGTTSTSSAGLPLPALNSLPGAKATIYLDFTGDSIAKWLNYTNITIPAFDLDGNPSQFSQAEVDAITAIWHIVAQDYAMWNLNVTTVDPRTVAGYTGTSTQIDIGGDGAWSGGVNGGLAEVGGHASSSATNPVRGFSFSVNLGNGNVWYTGQASAHEAGHTLGLVHQAAWSGTTKNSDYQQGPGDGTAPIMGISYYASRGMWWFGPDPNSPTEYQNDLSIISSNGFSYRTDEAGSTPGTATALPVSGSQITDNGLIISSMSDIDAWSFASAAGTLNLTVSAEQYSNLHPKIELVDSKGNAVLDSQGRSWIDPDTASITWTGTVATGTYYLLVASHGISSGATATNYGFDVGTYDVSGTLPTASTPPPPPPPTTGFTAHIRFTVSATDTVSGYLNDTGLAYGARSNGLTYGWNIDNSVNTRDREASNSPDDLHDDFIHMQKSSDPNASWSIAVPNGTYQVHLLSGDPQNWDSAYVLNVQGVQALKGTPSSTNLWFNGTVTVTVTNGLLSLTNGSGSVNDKIDVIDIVQLSPPAAPTGLTATAGTGQVSLSWPASTGAATYNVYRGTSAGGEASTPIATGITGTSFTDLSTVSGTTYFYQVTAVSAAGESARSSEVSATVQSTSLFSAYIRFTVSATDTVSGYLNDTGLAYGARGNGLTYGWNIDNSVNTRDREASNSPDDLHDDFIHMQKPSDPNASWSIAVPNGTYQVHLLSGDPQNWDSVFVLNVQGVQALKGTPSSTNPWFEGTVTVTVTNGVLSLTNGTGSSNNKIDAIDIVQVSAPAVPASPVATAGSGQVTLTWTASSGATSYNVYRGTSAGGEASTPIATGLTGTSFTDTGLANGTTYFYKITAVNAIGESARSSEVSATPQSTALFSAHINFSSSTTDVPAGYINDVGLAYGARGNGLTYGWNIDNTVNARDRNDPTSPDELHDSFIHMQKSSDPNAFWEIAVPNGTYQVHLLSGDPQNWDSVYVLNVEGVQALKGTPTSSNLWFEATVTVTVTDGRLTLSNGTGSVNNRIDAIDIVQTVGNPTGQA